MLVSENIGKLFFVLLSVKKRLKNNEHILLHLQNVPTFSDLGLGYSTLKKLVK